MTDEVFMRYIGGKSLLLDKILNVILKCTDGNIESITDCFSGSGAVGQFMKENGYKVFSNDLLYFSFVISRGTIGVNTKPTFSKLGIADPIAYLNELSIDESTFDLDKCFIYQNYSPNVNCKRMYFQNNNALRIDVIRLQIEEWKDEGRLTEDEYFYLLASLLLAVPYVANITGTFGAYLKYWDARTYNKLTLEHPNITVGIPCCCSCGDYLNVLSSPTDVLYADPPYNSREYLPNYHVMETIARYDYPVIKGVTGIREYTKQKSVFCKKATVEKAFDDLIHKSHSRYVVISYNNEGLLSTEKLTTICQKYAKPNTFKLIEYDYRRYKNKIPNDTEGLKEQLYFFERK